MIAPALNAARMAAMGHVGTVPRDKTARMDCAALPIVRGKNAAQTGVVATAGTVSGTLKTCVLMVFANHRGVAAKPGFQDAPTVPARNAFATIYPIVVSRCGTLVAFWNARIAAEVVSPVSRIAQAPFVARTDAGVPAENVLRDIPAKTVSAASKAVREENAVTMAAAHLAAAARLIRFATRMANALRATVANQQKQADVEVVGVRPVCASGAPNVVKPSGTPRVWRDARRSAAAVG